MAKVVISGVEVVVCDSRDHGPTLATVEMHWVTGPSDYCDRCADWMRQVAAVMATHVYEKPIVQHLPGPANRGIQL